MLKLSSTWSKYEQTLQQAHTTMLHFRATEPSSSINMPHIHQCIGNKCQSILPLVWYHTSFNDLFPETQCLWNLVQEFPPYKFRRNPSKAWIKKRFSGNSSSKSMGWTVEQVSSPPAPVNTSKVSTRSFVNMAPSETIKWRVGKNEWLGDSWLETKQLAVPGMMEVAYIHYIIYDIHEFAYAWTVSLDDHGLL